MFLIEFLQMPGIRAHGPKSGPRNSEPHMACMAHGGKAGKDVWPLQALHVHAKYCIQHHATCLRDLIHAFTRAVRNLAAPDPDALLAEVEKAAGRRFTSDYIAIRQKHS